MDDYSLSMMIPKETIQGICRIARSINEDLSKVVQRCSRWCDNHFLEAVALGRDFSLNNDTKKLYTMENMEQIRVRNCRRLKCSTSMFRNILVARVRMSIEIMDKKPAAFTTNLVKGVDYYVENAEE